MIGFPKYLLQRHPLRVRAHFKYSLVLTYAFEAEALERMLPEGLEVDEWNGWGFVAIAMVQTEKLRPTVVPRFLGQSFFLAGYRIFARFKPAADRTLRGLYILRSDTNRRLMAAAGNCLTHYRYRVSGVSTELGEGKLRCRIASREHAADLDVTAELAGDGGLPEGSPFGTFQEARRFAGPLPYTFDDEPETGSIIAIKAERRNWNPRLVRAQVDEATFFEHGNFAGMKRQLASAFYVEEIDYQWNRGVRHRLAATKRSMT